MLRSRAAGLILQVLLSGGTYRHTFGKYNLKQNYRETVHDEYIYIYIYIYIYLMCTNEEFSD